MSAFSQEQKLSEQEEDRSDFNNPQDEFVCFEIVADGFLYNMVRAIAGTLLKVGRGQWTANDVRRIIAGQDRSLAGETAPSCGLSLVRVDYPDDPPGVFSEITTGG